MSGLKPSRPWQVIAEEVLRESDPEKMAVLIDELNRALDEQRIRPSSQKLGEVKGKKSAGR